MHRGDAELRVSVLQVTAASDVRKRAPSVPPRRSSRQGGRFLGTSVMASQPSSSSKKKEEKGKNIQVVVRCR